MNRHYEGRVISFTQMFECCLCMQSAVSNGNSYDWLSRNSKFISMFL